MESKRSSPLEYAIPAPKPAGRWKRFIFLWIPAPIFALAAAIVPETFLDNPYTTVPHELAFQLRFGLIVVGFGYVLSVLLLRLYLYLHSD